MLLKAGKKVYLQVWEDKKDWSFSEQLGMIEVWLQENSFLQRILRSFALPLSAFVEKLLDEELSSS